MVLPESLAKYARKNTVLGTTSLFLMLAAPALPACADDLAAPTPGGRYTAPVPGGVPGYAAAPTNGGNVYQKLPLNAASAANRLEELRNLMFSMRPKEFQDAINMYCDWLSDMADSHWKIAQAFTRYDQTRPQAEAEKQACLRFGQLKRQAMLLKAEFLINQKRYPEALGPLIEIVVAEPRTETGQSAYRLLKEIGFVEEASKTANHPTPAPAEQKPVVAPLTPVTPQTTGAPSGQRPAFVNPYQKTAPLKQAVRGRRSL